jgi:SAM-dependent methyltransferase
MRVACGEGYGSALLAQSAASVTGVDIAADAIAHATASYRGLANLRYVEASCTRLPFADAAFDVVVSFETIEHITEHDAFLNEVRRVLTADGLLIISSPNKAEYTDARQFTNEFHVKELYRTELAAELAKRFAHTRWLSQRNGFYSLIAPDATGPANPSTGAAFAEVLTVSQAAPMNLMPDHAALYFLVLATNDAATLRDLPTLTSAFTDREEFALNDYRKIYRDLVSLAGKHQALHDVLAAQTRELEDLKQLRAAPIRPSWFARLLQRFSN